MHKAQIVISVKLKYLSVVIQTRNIIIINHVLGAMSQVLIVAILINGMLDRQLTNT